ncbi:hypothetical protein [Labedaea rhizosphaerae]|uniref:hypothetical protein n=1 Tax=Labedaea rhizosphaerae TaxID=598644 RepID=UPI001415272E|nr:hypothetical protein [Labedaea rhizosphaerae]
MGLAVALAVAVVALVVVLVSNGGDHDSAGPDATGGTGGTGGSARAARPTAVPNRQPVRPKSPYEQVGYDYVSAVQNNDLDSARRLACASFRDQVKLAPLGLHSPTGVTVDKVDTFELGGSSALGGTDGEPLEKASVGIRVQDGDNWVQWVFAIRPEGGAPRVCGQSVVDNLDPVPDPT